MHASHSTGRQAIVPGAPSQDYDASFEGAARDKTGITAPLPVPLWKRIFDLTLVFLTLPFWLPLMILISLVIKAVSRGPVVFCQRRIGLGGVPFMIFKFRSMQVNTETRCHEEHLDQLIKANRPMTKLDMTGDPRMIPGGKWFRASAMDELPQIFNVIRGEMSLVGLSPFMRLTNSNAINRNTRAIGTKILPGLTGYWQVNGKELAPHVYRNDRDGSCLREKNVTLAGSGHSDYHFSGSFPTTPRSSGAKAGRTSESCLCTSVGK